MKKFIQKNWFKLSLIVLLLFVGIVIYQSLVTDKRSEEYKEWEQELIISSQKIESPENLNQSQILQDRVNQTLLDSLYSQDHDKAYEAILLYNDEWRDMPNEYCTKGMHEIAVLVIGTMQENMMKKYGKSLNWSNGLELMWKSWCLDRGYGH